MNIKKENVNSLIQKSIQETLKQEDKIIKKDDLKKKPVITKEKPTEVEELTRLSVGGLTQAFDAMERAIKELNKEQLEKFALATLHHLKNAGVNGEVLKYFYHKFTKIEK